MALVPKQWWAAATANERNNYVEILARQSGLFAWLLALFRIDPTYLMAINHRRVLYEAASFSGYRKVVLPIDSISSSYFGYHRPWKAALSIGFLALMIAGAISEAGYTLWSLATFGLGILVAIVYYLLNKELLIGLTDVTGTDYALVLKRSVIGNQEINEQQMELVTTIVLTVIDNQKASKLVSPLGSPRAPDAGAAI